MLPDERLGIDQACRLKEDGLDAQRIQDIDAIRVAVEKAVVDTDNENDLCRLGEGLPEKIVEGPELHPVIEQKSQLMKEVFRFDDRYASTSQKGVVLWPINSVINEAGYGAAQFLNPVSGQERIE